MADQSDNSQNDQLSFDAFAVDLMERIKKARESADADLPIVSAAGIKKSKSRFKKEVEVVETKSVMTESLNTIVEKPVAADPRTTAMTVGQLNREIKSIIEKKYANVWVKGEISNCKIYGSGHMYFTLKDSESQISAVIFNAQSRLKFKPEDGMEVIVKGNVSLYLARGNHQLVCDLMEPVGFGALQLAYEQLKEKLQKEGLFEPSKKRPLPPFPQSIGLITSPTGAAVRDMVNVLSRRMAGSTQVTVIPTSVQGERANKEIVAAIELANRLAIFDVLIIGRGGGSIEDLWSFNTEEVVRAIAASKIPTISAVGHEVDFTIADFVADLRAPTPSAAAELVAKNKGDLIERIKLLTKQLLRQMQAGLEIKQHKFLTLTKGLVDPRQKLLELTQRNDDLSHRLQMGMFRFIEDSRLHVELITKKLPHPQVRLEQAARAFEGLMGRLIGQSTRMLERPREEFLKSVGLLDGLSPLKVLDRGYSIVLKSGQIVKNSGQIKAGDQVQITLSSGSAKAEIL